MIKKSFFAYIMVLILSICVLFSTSCSVFGGKLSDELPQENVLRIERITIDLTNGGEETSVNLSSEKIDEFFDILYDLEYVRYYNIRGVKCIPFDDVYYVITCETCTIRLAEHQFSVYKGEELQRSIRFQSINPSDKYNQLRELF